MSKGKEKVIDVDDDELDFLLSLLTDLAFDPGIPLEPILGPIKSSVGTSSRRMSPQKASSSGNSGGEESSTWKTP